MKRFSFLLVLAIAILSGCATTSNYSLNGANVQGGEVQRATIRPSQEVQLVSSDKLTLPTDPYHTLGVLKTNALAKGRVTMVEGVVPDIRFGEYFPGAIGGKCLAVLGEKEYFCQSVLYRLGEDSQFRAAFIIEGLPNEVRSAKIVALSLKGDYAYDLGGKEFLLNGKFSKEGKERRKFILEKGTLVESAPLVDPAIWQGILSWNEYSTPEGIVLSPLGKEDVNYIAGINPQYKFLDKWIGTGNFSLSASPSGMIAGLALDVFRAMNAPATGWDFSSQLPSRRQMGIIMQYVGNLKRQTFERMFSENQAMRIQLAGGKRVEPKTQPQTIIQPKPQPKKEVRAAKKEVVAERKLSVFSKISSFGYPGNIPIALAEKVRLGDFSWVGIQNPTRFTSHFKDGKAGKGGTLNWDDPNWNPKAQRYEERGFVLYRIVDGKGKEVFYRIN